MFIQTYTGDIQYVDPLQFINKESYYSYVFNQQYNMRCVTYQQYNDLLHFQKRNPSICLYKNKVSK